MLFRSGGFGQQQPPGPPDPKRSGVWRSDDKGKTWRLMANNNNRPMYYSQIRVDPTNPDITKAKGGLAGFLKDSAVKHRVYHGTTKDFGSFSHKHQYSGEGGSHSGSGFYFTDNPESASRYSMMRGESGANVMPVHLNIKKPLHFDWEQGETTGANLKLTPAQVKSIMLAHPKIRDENESPLTNWGDIRGAAFHKTLNDAVKSYAGSSMLAALRNDFFGDDHERWLRALHKATGYDSGTTITPTGERHYIAWFPEQIKSAIGNRGTYDPKNPDITMAKGGEVPSVNEMKAALRNAGAGIKPGADWSSSRMPEVHRLARNKDKFLYHSGNPENLESMHYAIEPQQGGPWIKEIAHGALDDVDNFLENTTPLAWFSDQPSWVKMMVSRIVKKPISEITNQDIVNYGHLAIISKKSPDTKNMYHIGSEGLSNGEYSDVDRKSTRLNSSH